MIEATLKIENKSFKVNEPVSFLLKISNTQDKTIKLFFPTTKIYDFAVYDENGKEVYRWSGNKLFTQVVTRVTLKPKEVREFHLEWNQKVGFGNKAKPGKYQIIAEVGPFWLEDERKKTIIKTNPLEIEVT